MLPPLVIPAREVVAGSPVVVACATGDFPAGAAPLTSREAEIRAAVAAGAQEIDAPIDRANLSDAAAVVDEVRALREAAGQARLKVILETGELDDLDLVHRAAVLAAGAGADMIKTSTGKTRKGATLEAAAVMARSLAEVRRVTGRAVGLKVAGGIRSAADACRYLEVVERVLGDTWLVPARFRIGASSLLDDVAEAAGRA